MTEEKTEEKPKYPNLRPPWKKGECPPGAGRPKGLRNRSTIAREWLEADAIDELPGTLADQAMREQIKKALAGNLDSFREVMDSAYGKNPDVQHIGGVDGGKIPIEITTPEEAARALQDKLKKRPDDMAT